MRKSNISKIPKVILLLISVWLPLNSRAQDTADTKGKMIEIKLNEDFIFGEAISDDKEIAYGEALDDLLIFANEIKDRNSQEQIALKDLITNVETLVYEDGKRYEVLVYIPFKIVIETDSRTSEAKSEIKKTEEVSSPAPVTVVEAQAVVEEPQVETIAEPLTAVETIPETETVAVEIVQPNTETEAISQPETVTETVTVSETPDLPAEKEDMLALEVSAQENTPTLQPISPSGDEIEEFLTSQENFSEIKSFLSEMKKAGKIKETGAVEASDTPPSDASIIMIDGLGGILSILSPTSGEGRINYKTQKTDSEKNYNSKFIVWYRK